jgi:rhodanese-related sulfurtransferase
MAETEKTLIQGSLTAEMELRSINELMSKNEFDTSIIVYGRNDHDYDSLMTKQKQLKSLGFRNVFIYLGGMFEWLLLQDVFGANLFPTTVAKVDLLRFAP